MSVDDGAIEQEMEESLSAMGEAEARDIQKEMKTYDVIKVKKWECPESTGVPIITMPNVPRPLHGKGMQPRTIYGKSTWDFLRKKAYYNAGYKCEICGREPERGDLHAHELFTYDYEHTTGEFKRVVAICRTCHDAIHSGRLITMFKNKNPLYPKSYVLRVVENCFKLVYNYNKEHDEDEQLRVYATYLEYLDMPELRSEMEKLIDKYHIKFYEEELPKKKRWKGWKLVVGKNTYNSPYSSQGEWEEAMKQMNASDNVRTVADPFSGGVFEEIDKFFQESVDTNTQA